MWISPEFKIYLVKEFRRLKDEENNRLKLDWKLQRTLAKINYRIHTDATKETLLPPAITKAQASTIYASEADLLNVALFGQTAKQWRDAHPDAEGNIRDHAPLEQLVVLTNLESLNSVLIRQELPQTERLSTLNGIAISQMRTLLERGIRPESLPPAEDVKKVERRLTSEEKKSLKMPDVLREDRKP